MTKSKVRYSHGSFPKTTVARQLDDNCLHYWRAAREGDPIRRYIYYYRLIEYAPSIYIDGQNRHIIKRLFSSPNALDNIGELSERALLILSRYTTDDPTKMSKLLDETVDRTVLWAEIEQNKSHFSEDGI
jgi:hypothetical protein